MTGLPLILLLAAQESVAASHGNGSELSASTDDSYLTKIWHGEVGRGFKGNTKSFEMRLGRAFGTTSTGSNNAHDLWFTELQFGLILADVMEPDHWFGGNIEGLGKIIAAAQERPHSAYLFALNGGLRYHFRTGTRIVPYLGGNIGIGITDISDDDASGKFQFNQQAGVGLRYFFDPQTALVVDYAYWHVSNAGIREPNDGVNCHNFTVGISWLF
ncbi:MAG TPA: acyloxyacyl hydrolase [Verrucomicrobiae bacterium]